MNKFLLSWFAFLACCTLSWGQTAPPETPQQETLLKPTVRHSFYVAPSLLLSRWQEHSGLMLGGKAAWVVNKKIGLGVAGYGLISNNNIGEIAQNNNAMLQVGYAGLLLEYTPNPTALVHLSFPVTIGAGGAAYTNSATGNTSSGAFSYEIYETDTFFVLEPGLQAELNLTSFMRLGLNVSYRFAYGVDLPKSTDRDLSAPAVALVFKLGRF